MTLRRLPGTQLAAIAAALVLALILSACQPVIVSEQQPADQPTAGITTEDLIGIWRDRAGIYTQFLEDGTFRATEVPGNLEAFALEWGTFQLQGSTLTMVTAEDHIGCPGGTGKYEVSLNEDGDLVMTLLEDECSTRGSILSSAPLEESSP
jgi:hypothetical protein